jgi:hypothetical protein
LPERLRNLTGLFLAACAAASMWFYVLHILRARQIADSVEKGIPRGKLSDLYPRWLAARELLLHRRNPYSREITLQIQEGYYGRQLDPGRPNDPKDQQGFAYPVYVVFLLAPLIRLPFDQVQGFFHWLLIVVTAGTVWLWSRGLRWRLPPVALITAGLLMIGNFPAVQGIRLQQLSLLVAALLAASLACAARGFLLCSGVLLALSTIKPQLAWLLTAWLLVWAFAELRGRRGLLWGFGLTMGLLLLGGELVLPGWWRMFLTALHEYRGYTNSESVLDQLVPWMFGGKILAAVAMAASAVLLWKLPGAPAKTEQFGRAISLVVALTVLVVPMYAPYNQVLLLPAILVLVRDRKMFLSGPRGMRPLYVGGSLVLGWQWAASLVLDGLYLFKSPAMALAAWSLPLFATFALPLLVFGLMMIDVQRSSRELLVPGGASKGKKEQEHGN